MILLKKYFVHFAVITTCSVLFNSFVTPANSELNQTADKAPQSHLARAIELYHEGRYDESFEELTAQVDINRFCALAYYYRARIRVIKKNYSTAEKSILAALRDSTDFTDAVGLHAYILKEMGKTENAIEEWRRFIADVGSPDGEISTTDSIMLPEQYREKLNLIRKEQSKISSLEPEKPEAEPEEQKILTDIWDGRVAENQLPMAVVDIIDQENVGKTVNYSHNKLTFVSAALIISIAAGLIILFLYLKFRKSSKQAIVNLDIETEVQQGDSSIMQSEEEKEITISDMGTQPSELFLRTPLAQSLSLKDNRKKHAREIERLMNKL